MTRRELITQSVSALVGTTAIPAFGEKPKIPSFDPRSFMASTQWMHLAATGKSKVAHDMVAQVAGKEYAERFYPVA